jgi:hypothetical protein
MRKLILPLILLSLVLPAAAVSTSHWTQNSQSDFKDGTFHHVVVTNLGDVRLSRGVKTLLEDDSRVSMVTALAEGTDGAIYAGTAPQGVLLRISGGKVTTAATIDNAVSITALLPEANGGLLIGTSGATGHILRLDKPGEKPHEIFAGGDVQYIWGLVESTDGMIYAATGPGGGLIAISPGGKSETIYKSDGNNLTAIATDGKDNLYVGTDPNGRVVRINRKTKESFVLFNADESEITALAMDKDGNLFAATGAELTPETDQQQQSQQNEQPKDNGGRPQSPTTSPLPSQPPMPPKPPQRPNPDPDNPSGIPNQPTGLRFPLPADEQPVLMVTDMDAAPDQPAPPDIPGLPDQPSEPTTPSAGEQPSGGKTDDNSKNQQAAEGDQSKPQGNAIYKIDRDGFVTEIFRDQVVIYSLLSTNGVLLAGTGDDGEIYQVDPDAQETVVIAKTDVKEVTAMLAGSDGQVYLGLSNTGGVAAMTAGYADSGTFISPVLDATQTSRFGVIQMHGSMPKGTQMTVATRSGNVKEAEAEGWSAWSAEQRAREFLHVTSPTARFFQYRVTFTSSDPSQTPVINDMDEAYQLPHLAPVVKSIKISDAPAGGAPAAGAAAAPSGDPKADSGDAAKTSGTGSQLIAWDTSDIDNDPLVYTLYFRTASGGPWILLKDKLTDSSFTWDTRSVADGRYQVKVIASDALANPPGDGKTAGRVSDVLVVDNTPPAIGDIVTTITGHTVSIQLRVTVGVGTVAAMDYSVDSNDTWQTVLPVDGIFDQPEEQVAISVADLSPGEHQISLRATDDHGNMAYQTVTVSVGRN